MASMDEHRRFPNPPQTASDRILAHISIESSMGISRKLSPELNGKATACRA